MLPLFVVLVIAVALARAVVIVPGADWTDTDGNPIQGHGAGKFGEDKSLNSILFHAISCYTSTDLGTWTRQNNALTPIAGTMISDENVVERPKVIFNTKNSEYVLWFHSDNSDYGAAMVGVATASTPCTAYLLYASDNNQDFKISMLNADYLNVTEQIYYLIASHTTGWDPNPNKVFSATSLAGPWSAQVDIAPENVNTYNSQNAYDMLLGTSAIYMVSLPHELSVHYVWFPLSWSSSSGLPVIVPADVWDLNIAAGTYTVETGTAYQAESGTLGGSAVILTNSVYSNGEAVGFLGNGGTLTMKNIEGIGADQWVALYYANGDSTYRNTTISVNGGANIVVQQPPSGGGQVIQSTPVQLNLKSGANTLVFSADQSNFAGDLDRIIVYTAT
ncbi:galactan 1,3-beta-galactosidase [Gymnopus androsaceus JB14]|uniref:Galactan 1,3-beta-galactosidase n=1 Tax=Gymnopus androsaceus JB14 TaxID=1447944 RepID=A0A6A4IFB7_9AGAR|nr:galactan 1,3-beta-galactosidase [Gymnopus androsaceus JB14]